MVSVCTVPARGGRSCEHFGGYKTINRIPLYTVFVCRIVIFWLAISLWHVRLPTSSALGLSRTSGGMV